MSNKNIRLEFNPLLALSVSHALSLQISTEGMSSEGNFHFIRKNHPFKELQDQIENAIPKALKQFDSHQLSEFYIRMQAPNSKWSMFILETKNTWRSRASFHYALYVGVGDDYNLWTVYDDVGNAFGLSSYYAKDKNEEKVADSILPIREFISENAPIGCEFLDLGLIVNLDKKEDSHDE